MTDLGYNQVTDSATAYSINDEGQVVGEIVTTDGYQYGVLWENGDVLDLGTIGGNYCAAYSINNNGQIAGYSSTSGDATDHVFLWESGTMKDLGVLGASSYCYAWDINDHGQIAGFTLSDNDDFNHAFITVTATPTATVLPTPTVTVEPTPTVTKTPQTTPTATKTPQLTPTTTVTTTPSQEEYDFNVETVFNPVKLVPNQMMAAKATAANISSASYEGVKDVLLIVALYDANNTMVNVSYISKGIAYKGTETLTAGFKLPPNVTGYTVKTFMWDGQDIKTSFMIPQSNVVQIS